MLNTRGYSKERSVPDFSSSQLPAPSKSSRGRQSTGKWTHIPTATMLAWLIISTPIVIWDTGYVLLRPLSMPGGSLHSPIWVLYEIYMRTDYLYGWKAIEEKNGFTAAQASMNVLETLLYFYYLWLVYSHGIQLKATSDGAKPRVLANRNISGQPGALAVIAGFAASVMTFSKTSLYGLNEAFSGWSNVGHNEWIDLIFVYIIPNGAWLVSSAIMAVAFGRDILEGLTLASGEISPEKPSVVKKD